MANSKCTAPINVSNEDITDDCHLKCLYKYNYRTNPATTATNNGDHLTLSYDKVRIKFNNDDLLTNEIRIYRPSLHTYEGSKAEAEMIINHSGAGVNLLVCIPIVISNGKTEASEQMKKLIEQAFTKVPLVGESSVIQTSYFSLDAFIPKKSGFFSYVGTTPYSPCSGTNQYVVFTPKDSQIYMSSKTYGMLSKMIVENKNNVVNNPNQQLYYNKRGAIYLGENRGADEDDIYIDCSPTGAEDDIATFVSVSNEKNKEQPLNFNNPVVITIIGLLAGFLVIFIISTVLKFVRGRSSSSGSVSRIGGIGDNEL